MTKIESRPTKGWLGDYVFLIDFEGHRQDERVARVLDTIRGRCSMLKIFGSYPRFPLETLRDAIDRRASGRLTCLALQTEGPTFTCAC